MRAIGKLPKGVLILEFIGMMLLAVALLSVSDSLSLPEPFSRPEVQILMIFLGVLLMLPAAVVVILQVAKRLAPQLMNRPPQYSRSEREKDNDANPLNLFVAIAPFAISLMNPFPKRSVRRLLTAPVRRPVPVFCSAVALFALPTKRYVKNW